MTNLAGKLLKTLGLILAFILSFPFSLLYWPVKAAFSKHNTPAGAVPTQDTAQPAAPIVAVEVAQDGLVATPTAAVESPNQPPVVLLRQKRWCRCSGCRSTSSSSSSRSSQTITLEFY